MGLRYILDWKKLDHSNIPPTGKEIIVYSRFNECYLVTTVEGLYGWRDPFTKDYYGQPKLIRDLEVYYWADVPEGFPRYPLKYDFVITVKPNATIMNEPNKWVGTCSTEPPEFDRTALWLHMESIFDDLTKMEFKQNWDGLPKREQFPKTGT